MFPTEMLFLLNALVSNSQFRHGQNIHMYRHICNVSSPDGSMNGSQQLRKISKNFLLL